MMAKKWIFIGCMITMVGMQQVNAKEKSCAFSRQVTVLQQENTCKKYDFDTLALLEAIQANQKDYTNLLLGPYALKEVSVQVIPKKDPKSSVVVQFTFIAQKIVSPMHSEEKAYQGERKLIIDRTEEQGWKYDTEEKPTFKWKSSGVIQVKQPKGEPISDPLL